jgi:hypothetical protein
VWDELASQIEFECGQLQKLFDLFRPVIDGCAQGEPGRFEVAALGAMLHSFYGGVENVFKRISLEVDGGLPSGDAWHSALLNSMAGPGARRVFRFSWKWRKRSTIKIMERTHEEATEALYAGRESRHPEAASIGAGSDLRIM